MNPSRTRLICLAGALICGIASLLIAVYLFALSDSSVASLCGLALTLVLFGYFGSSAVHAKFLWHPLLLSKPFLCVLASGVTCVSLFCLASTLSTSGHTGLNLYVLALLGLSTLAAAALLRYAFGVYVFGWLSLVFSIPIGLLSVAPISYLAFPPSADPVGGAGISIGIITMWMIPFVAVVLPMWIAAVYFERWQLGWHIAIGMLCLPGTAAMGILFAGIDG